MAKRGNSSTYSKDVWLLGGSSFLNDLGGEMIVPILPFFITMMGGGGVALGLLSGLREGLSSIFKVFGGWASDFLGKRKIFVFLGYLLSSISKFFIAFSTSWQWLISFVSLERFGKFRDAPRDAMVSHAKKARGKNFGIIQMMDTLGGVMGTILVLFLFWKFSLDLKKIILIAAIVAVLSPVPVLFVKEHKLKPIKKKLHQSIRDLSPDLKYFILVSAIFAFGNFGIYLFLILMAQSLTHSMFLALLFYVLFSATYSIFVIPFGSLSDRIGRGKILMAGFFLFLLVALGFIFLNSVTSILILFILYGLTYAMINPVQRALVSDMSGKMKGTAFGFFYTVTGVAGIIGGVIAGFLWDISHKLMFQYISVVAAVSIVMLLFFENRN